MVVYIAGALFNEAERNFLEKMEHLVKEAGFETYLPHRDGGLFIKGVNRSRDFFERDLEALKNSEIIVADFRLRININF